MEYAIYITLDEELKEDYCLISSDESDEMIYLNVYTNGKNKIDFRKLNYFSFNSSYCSNFMSYFSYGRNVFDNAKILYLTNSTEKEKNTKDDNKKLMSVVDTNGLVNKKIYLDIGEISLTDDDLDSLKPFKRCKAGLVTFGETNIYHNIEELETIKDITNEIVKRTIKHDFSQLEKMLYAYDIIRTNFAVNKEYEKKMEKILSLYTEPSFCYSLIYKEVLDRFKIKNIYSFGNFLMDEMRAINIAYVNDPDYEIEGVYYFDIGNNSKQRILNSIVDIPKEDPNDDLINNYESFCKTKTMMEIKGCLDIDHTFGDFDEDFMNVYDFFLEKEGINGVYKLRGILNNVGYFIDGRTVIDSFKGIEDEAELDEIKNDTERYVELFSNDIEGEDFLEMLFNVRKIEYIENKELYPLSVKALKKCLFKSGFTFSKMNLDFQDDQEYELEDISELIEESFESSFEESINNQHIEDRIRTLKLSLNNENKPNKEENN